ncbi:MAG: MBOAT family O-acyltransferase [Oscillospiraceae bacterium]
MSYTSLTYVVFMIVVGVLYYCIPKKARWGVLLASSVVFYFFASRFLIAYLGVTTITIYLCGLWIDKISTSFKENKKKPDVSKDEIKALKTKMKRDKKIAIAVAIIVNFGILFFLKYFNAFGNGINMTLSIFGVDALMPHLKFIAPLGISYYTLQAVSYIIDVYRGTYKADKNFFRLSLYVCFFPQMVEGPIGRYDKMAHQLYEGHEYNYQNICHGVQLMVWGLFKKMVIADRAAMLVNTVFDHSENYSGFIVLIGAILYTVQIYAEFSGCMDLVTGTAEVFGISLAQNFRQPFFSGSIDEFWRRWHITLGAWLRDYIFYPVSLSKATQSLSKKVKGRFGEHLSKFIPMAFALFFVWIGNGIWHGAGAKYIFYGMYYYVIMMLGKLLEPFFQKVLEKLKINTENLFYKGFCILRTSFIVLIGMLIFRANSLKTAFKMFASMFTGLSIKALGDGTLFSLELSGKDFIVLLIGIIAMFVVDILHEKNIEIRKTVSKQFVVLRWAFYFIAIFSVIIFGIYGEGYTLGSFIYGDF